MPNLISNAKRYYASSVDIKLRGRAASTSSGAESLATPSSLSSSPLLSPDFPPSLHSKPLLSPHSTLKPPMPLSIAYNDDTVDNDAITVNAISPRRAITEVKPAFYDPDMRDPSLTNRVFTDQIEEDQSDPHTPTEVHQDISRSWVEAASRRTGQPHVNIDQTRPQSVPSLTEGTPPNLYAAENVNSKAIDDVGESPPARGYKLQQGLHQYTKNLEATYRNIKNLMQRACLYQQHLLHSDVTFSTADFISESDGGGHEKGGGSVGMDDSQGTPNINFSPSLNGLIYGTGDLVQSSDTKWDDLFHFLSVNQDYNPTTAVTLLVKRGLVYISIYSAHSRNIMEEALGILINNGITSVSIRCICFLIVHGYSYLLFKTGGGILISNLSKNWKLLLYSTISIREHVCSFPVLQDPLATPVYMHHGDYVSPKSPQTEKSNKHKRMPSPASLLSHAVSSPLTLQRQVVDKHVDFELKQYQTKSNQYGYRVFHNHDGQQITQDDLLGAAATREIENNTQYRAHVHQVYELIAGCTSLPVIRWICKSFDPDYDPTQAVPENSWAATAQQFLVMTNLQRPTAQQPSGVTSSLQCVPPLSHHTYCHEYQLKDRTTIYLLARTRKLYLLKNGWLPTVDFSERDDYFMLWLAGSLPQQQQQQHNTEGANPTVNTQSKRPVWPPAGSATTPPMPNYLGGSHSSTNKEKDKSDGKDDRDREIQAAAELVTDALQTYFGLYCTQTLMLSVIQHHFLNYASLISECDKKWVASLKYRLLSLTAAIEDWQLALKMDKSDTATARANHTTENVCQQVMQHFSDVFRAVEQSCFETTRRRGPRVSFTNQPPEFSDQGYSYNDTGFTTQVLDIATPHKAPIVSPKNLDEHGFKVLRQLVYMLLKFSRDKKLPVELIEQSLITLTTVFPILGVILALAVLHNNIAVNSSGEQIRLLHSPITPPPPRRSRYTGKYRRNRHHGSSSPPSPSSGGSRKQHKYPLVLNFSYKIYVVATKFFITNLHLFDIECGDQWSRTLLKNKNKQLALYSPTELLRRQQILEQIDCNYQHDLAKNTNVVTSSSDFLQALEEGRKTEPGTVVVFTCGHCYEKDQFVDKILPEFYQTVFKLFNKSTLPVSISITHQDYMLPQISQQCPKCILDHLSQDTQESVGPV